MFIFYIQIKQLFQKTRTQWLLTSQKRLESSQKVHISTNINLILMGVKLEDITNIRHHNTLHNFCYFINFHHVQRKSHLLKWVIKKVVIVIVLSGFHKLIISLLFLFQSLLITCISVEICFLIIVLSYFFSYILFIRHSMCRMDGI